jgi:hypothetical protein
LSRKEKEALAIKLAKEGKTTRQIAKEAHLSLLDIGEIIRKITGDDKVLKQDEIRKEELEQKNRIKKLSPYAQAFQMFRERKSLSEVVVALDLKSDVVVEYYADYLDLINMRRLVKIYKEIGDDLAFFLYLYNRIIEEELDSEGNIEQLLHDIKQLSQVNNLLNQSRSQLKDLDLKRQNLENYINQLTNRLGRYDGTPSSFSL